MTVSAPTQFAVDSNVIIYLFASDAAKADRAEASVGRGTRSQRGHARYKPKNGPVVPEIDRILAIFTHPPKYLVNYIFRGMGKNSHGVEVF